MSFCSFQPMDLCSSIYQVPDHSFLPYNHTSSVLIHLDIRSRYTYTYTPFWLHSLTLLVRLLDHHSRSEEHTSELQSRGHLVCRLLLEKKNRIVNNNCH